MMPAFLEPFWAQLITVEDGEYMISDVPLNRVMSATTDLIGDVIDSQVVIDAALDGV